MKLEVVTVPVSDVDRAKEFYLGPVRRSNFTPHEDVDLGDRKGAD